LHRAIGETLERLYPDRRDELSDVLAHHFAAAGERDKAIEYSRQAARRAESAHAYQEASQHLQAAMALLPVGEQADLRLTLIEELADDLRFLGERARAIALYQDALDLWQSRPRPEQWTAVRLHRKTLEAYHFIGIRAEADRLQAAADAAVKTGLGLIEGEPPHPEAVRLLATIANDPWETHRGKDPEMVEQCARRAIEMAELLDAPVELSAALGALAIVHGARGLFRERMEVALRRVTLSRDPRFNDVREQINILCRAGDSLMYVGEYARALPFVMEAEALANQIRDVNQQAYALGVQAQCLFALDRWDEMLAIEEKRLAMQRFYGVDLLGQFCLFCGMSVNVLGWQGEFDRARSRREEIYNFMMLDGPPETWPGVARY
jgi:tetratricopeptide (TPR) repeat protein